MREQKETVALLLWREELFPQMILTIWGPNPRTGSFQLCTHLSLSTHC